MPHLPAALQLSHGEAPVVPGRLQECKSAENCAANPTDESCHVATIMISPSTPAGSTSSTLFDHYSLLGTTEQLLGLPELGQASASTTMTAAFNL
jgi:phosphatidylinositol-3-phosphatase